MGHTRPGPGERGFTLTELLVAVAIIGIIAAIAVVNLRDSLDKSRQRETVATMRNLASAVAAYQVDHSQLPADGTTGAALATVLHGITFNAVETKDGWRHDIAYNTDGASYTLRSYGRDGQLGPTDVSFATRANYDNDLVLVDGIFTAAPE